MISLFILIFLSIIANSTIVSSTIFSFNGSILNSEFSYVFSPTFCSNPLIPSIASIQIDSSNDLFTLLTRPLLKNTSFIPVWSSNFGFNIYSKPTFYNNSFHWSSPEILKQYFHSQDYLENIDNDITFTISCLHSNCNFSISLDYICAANATNFVTSTPFKIESFGFYDQNTACSTLNCEGISRLLDTTCMISPNYFQSNNQQLISMNTDFCLSFDSNYRNRKEDLYCENYCQLSNSHYMFLTSWPFYLILSTLIITLSINSIISYINKSKYISFIL